MRENMSISYTVISKFYRLLDTIYFRNNSNNPRHLLLNKIPNDASKVLEIAIGTAENSMLLAKQKPNIKIVGIDVSNEMLEIAQNKIKKEKIANIELIAMDAMNMAFDNEAFDYIIISLLLHEIPENAANRILSDCKRILKPDGKLMVLEWEEPTNVIQKILFSIIQFLEPFANKEYRTFMKKDLNTYFIANGFRTKSIAYGDYSKVIELEKSASCT